MGNEEEKPILVRNSNNGTVLNPDSDVDLQHLASNKFEDPKRGKKEALRKINEITGLTLTESDFEQLSYQADMLTGKRNEPVEWRCIRDGKYKKQPGKWIAETSKGPDRPHIGYRVEFDDGAGPKRVKAGHIFVNSVPASRMAPKVQRT